MQRKIFFYLRNSLSFLHNPQLTGKGSNFFKQNWSKVCFKKQNLTICPCFNLVVRSSLFSVTNRRQAKVTSVWNLPVWCTLNKCFLASLIVRSFFSLGRSNCSKYPLRQQFTQLWSFLKDNSCHSNPSVWCQSSVEDNCFGKSEKSRKTCYSNNSGNSNSGNSQPR